MDFRSIINKVAKAAKPYITEDQPDILADVAPDNLRAFIRACGDPAGAANNNPVFLPDGPRYWDDNTILTDCPSLTYEEYLSYRTRYKAAKRCPANEAELIEALVHNGINPESLNYPPYSNGGICIRWEFTAYRDFVQGGTDPCPIQASPACRCCCYNNVGGIWKKSARGAEMYGLCGSPPALPNAPFIGD